MGLNKITQFLHDKKHKVEAKKYPMSGENISLNTSERFAIQIQKVFTN